MENPKDMSPQECLEKIITTAQEMGDHTRRGSSKEWIAETFGPRLSTLKNYLLSFIPPKDSPAEKITITVNNALGAALHALENSIRQMAIPALHMSPEEAARIPAPDLASLLLSIFKVMDKGHQETRTTLLKILNIPDEKGTPDTPSLALKVLNMSPKELTTEERASLEDKLKDTETKLKDAETKIALLTYSPVQGSCHSA